MFGYRQTEQKYYSERSGWYSVPQDPFRTSSLTMGKINPTCFELHRLFPTRYYLDRF